MIERLGDAEVDDLRDRPAIDLDDEDVRRLQVAMHDALLMRVLNAVADAEEELEALLDRIRAAVAVLDHLFAVEQLHHEVRIAFRRRPGLEDLRDVGMLQARHRLLLCLKASAILGPREGSANDFDRDAAPHRRILLGEEHRAHAAFADDADQAIRTDRG